MASKKKANHFQHRDGQSDEHKIRGQVGPADFFKLVYRGPSYDHASDFIKFREKWRNYVFKEFNTKLECIESSGTMPVVPELDLEMLLSLAPKEYSDEDDDNDELLLKPPKKKAENYTAMNRLSAIVFEQTVKTHASKREDAVLLLKQQCERYFDILWRQLSLPMQHYIERFKDYAASKLSKNPVWLWKCIQSICLGIESVSGYEDSSIKRM